MLGPGKTHLIRYRLLPSLGEDPRQQRFSAVLIPARGKYLFAFTPPSPLSVCETGRPLPQHLGLSGQRCQWDRGRFSLPAGAALAPWGEAHGSVALQGPCWVLAVQQEVSPSFLSNWGECSREETRLNCVSLWGTRSLDLKEIGEHRTLL